MWTVALGAAGKQKQAEVKGALRADDQDILSAYSSEQGAVQAFPRNSCSHACICSTID